MKIYTKKGDKGQTSLLGGTRVPKHHIRIEAYGTVDELNSHIGLIRDQEVGEHTAKILLKVQDRLLAIASNLAFDPGKSNLPKKSRGIKIPGLKEEDVNFLEKEIDKMNESLPEMRSFVIPGGHTTVSFCHIARCVCRRAERTVTQLSGENYVPELIIKYLNRLSDYLFILSRKFSQVLNVKEIPWNPDFPA
ncbi:MAG: cob(I)yrinic acid a,c-diamide adenosyltransferase [Bacteroidota bacterium]